MANDYQILIEKYLNGTASSEEVARVESLINTDPYFAELMNNEQLINEFAHLGGLMELKAKMKTMDFPKPSKPYAKWGIAAATVLAVLFTYLILNNNASNSKAVVPENKEVTIVENNSKKKNTAKKDSIRVKPTPEKVTATKEKPVNPIKKKSLSEKKASIPDTTSQKEVVIIPEVEDNIVPEEQDEVLKTDSTTNNCQLSFIEPEFEVKPSCEDNNTGEIMINDISGSSPPFRYKVVENTDYTFNRIFSNLPAGSYNINIADADTCVTSFTVTVGEKECQDEGEKIISSLLGTPCVFDLKDENGIIYFYNSNGALIKQLTFSNAQSVEWYGKDNNGTPLPTGEYFYQIKYSSGESETGNITIAN